MPHDCYDNILIKFTPNAVSSSLFSLPLSVLSSPLLQPTQFIVYNHKSLGSQALSLRQHIPHSKNMTHVCVCVCVQCVGISDLLLTKHFGFV